MRTKTEKAKRITKSQRDTDLQERTEKLLDRLAFEKGNQGGPVSYDEFQRGERYRRNHPAEAAAADAQRPVESHESMMLRDKDYKTQPPY